MNWEIFIALLWTNILSKVFCQSPLLNADHLPVIENNPMTLTCRLPREVMQVSWWRNGVSAGMWTGLYSDLCQSSPSPLPDGFSTSCFNNSVYTLTFEHVKQNREGEFWNCAVNYIGSTVTYSNSITINVIVPIKRLAMNPEVDPISLIASQSAQFTCTSDFGRPSPSIFWFKKNPLGGNPGSDINVTAASQTTTSNNSIAVSTLSFEPSMSDHNMRLYCTGINGAQAVASEVKPLINVLYGPTAPEISLNGSVLTTTLNIRSGQHLSIRCFSGGNPPHTYLWSFPGGSATGGDLVISDVQPVHEGNFTCTARNTMSASTGLTVSEQKSSTIAVQVLLPIAHVDIVGENAQVSVMKINDTRYFVCEASTGKPVATIQWFKDNRSRDIITDDIPFQVTNYNSTIKIDRSVRSVLTYHAKSTDNGMRIYCTARNAGDVLYSAIQIQLVITSTPVAPASLQVNEVNINYASVCWNYGVKDVIYPNFVLELKRTDTQWTGQPVSDMNINSNSRICTAIRSLNTSTTYDVRVYAENAIGRSEYSNSTSFTTLSESTQVPLTERSTPPLSPETGAARRVVVSKSLVFFATVVVGVYYQ
ncbi:cell adhesion molecule DSCAM-like isoform X1 [Dreissena polymorpha]|uniref:cell adhesion molecule DSCAM-like isoform X1 n=1 Tax=Dreissena polymorpha TaxID=45954 RepID=UPI002264CF50|nr:cell adhesion molecule DSCAM-like isoform X1 [Dreissena polymorpha]